MQKQTLHCLFQMVLSRDSTHLCRHSTVDKIILRISWMKARAQRRVVNHLGQWKMSFLKNLCKPLAPEFACKLYYMNISLLKIKHFRLSSIITAYRRVIEVIQFSSHWNDLQYIHTEPHTKKSVVQFYWDWSKKELGLGTVWAFNAHQMMIWSGKIIPFSSQLLFRILILFHPLLSSYWLQREVHGGPEQDENLAPHA